jgi:HEXXH motif-containing protein
MTGPMTTTYHRLEPGLFARLGTGGGGVAAVEALAAAQVSRHLLLIAGLLREWPGHTAERDAIADTLERARMAAPGPVRRVVGAPLVGAWASITNRALRQGRAAWADVAHLGALAMVACAVARVDGEAVVPVRDGLVALPGLGVARVGGPGIVRVVARAGRLAVHAADAADAVHAADLAIPVLPGQAADAPLWQAVRPLDGDHGELRIRLDLDDLDPYRHGHHAPPAPRLPDEDLARWRRCFADAWRLLADGVPDRAAELAAGLRTLVPLVQTDRRSARSATIRHAFGVFGLTRPASAADFAVTLVHEFQHSKLSALLDLVPLIDPADERRYFAPWRTDPRPLAGLLQGVYAFVGVADTWRALRGDDGIAAAAERQFAEARLQVDRGLAAVEGSGALTPEGEALAAQLRRTTDTLLAEPVPPAVAREAARTLDRVRQEWLRRNSAQVDAQVDSV